MISRSEFLACSIRNFSKFGSKHFTLDELAKEMGMSKKTIYCYFKNKEDLVAASLSSLFEKIKIEVDEGQTKADDPIVKIILIYQIGFNHFKSFKPSFLFGLKKYYPKAYEVFDTFRNELVFENVFHLLFEAQEKQIIKPNVDIKLVCELYFLRIENIVYTPSNFFDRYSNDQLLEHLIIYNLRGICSENYSNAFFK